MILTKQSRPISFYAQIDGINDLYWQHNNRDVNYSSVTTYYAFAVGVGGAIRKRGADGTWSVHSSPTSSDLSVVRALDADRFYVAAGPQLYYYDGSIWHNAGGNTYGNIYDILVILETEVYTARGHYGGSDPSPSGVVKWDGASETKEFTHPQWSSANAWQYGGTLAIDSEGRLYALSNAPGRTPTNPLYTKEVGGSWAADTSFALPLNKKTSISNSPDKSMLCISDIDTSGGACRVYSGAVGAWTSIKDGATTGYDIGGSTAGKNNFIANNGEAFVSCWDNIDGWKDIFLSYASGTWTRHATGVGGLGGNALDGFDHDNVFFTIYGGLWFWNGASISNITTTAQAGTACSFNNIACIGITVATDDDTTITHATRTVRSCLHVGGSYGSKLDPKSGVEDSTTLSLRFDDILDTDGKSYFAKLFCDARWRAANHTYLAEGATPNQWIEATDKSLAVEDDTQLDAAPATAYLEHETIRYTAKSSNTLSGVTRGLYPAIDGAIAAKAYPRAARDSAAINSPVGTAPYFFKGRIIALYITRWDPATWSWSAGELWWAGRISNYYQEGTQWVVVAESLIKDLDRPVIRNQDARKGALKTKGINNLYNSRVKAVIPLIVIHEFRAGIQRGTYEITVPSGWYADQTKLCHAITNDFKANKASYWHSLNSASSLTDYIYLYVNSGEDGIYRATLVISASDDEMIWSVHFTGLNTHWARALGFRLNHYTIESNDNDYAEILAEDPAFIAYHPMSVHCNGKKIYVEDVDDFIEQRDIGGGAITSKGYNQKNTEAAEPDVEVITVWEGSGSDSNGEYLTLMDPYYSAINRTYEYRYSDYLAAKQEGKPVELEISYVPWDSSRPRPFEIMLRILKSTGSHINGAGDVLHACLSLGMPSVILDEDSFYEADKAVANNPLAQRTYYLIGKKDTFRDIVERECQLFGYWFGWRRGKYGVYPIAPVPWNHYTQTIDEDVILAGWDPKYERSSVIANVFEYKFREEIFKEKENTFRIKLANSVQVFDEQVMKLEHPGVISAEIKLIEAELRNAATNRALFAYQKPQITVPLAHTLFDQIYPGEPVVFSHDRLRDIFGTGDLGVLCYGVIQGVSWDLQGLLGQADILLNDVQDLEHPVAPAALVDSSATNGGYDTVNRRLTLIDCEYGPKTHNLILQSQALGEAAWTKNDGTISSNTGADIDGNTTADSFVPDAATTSGQYIEQAITWSYPGRYCYAGVWVDCTATLTDADYLIIDLIDSRDTIRTVFKRADLSIVSSEADRYGAIPSGDLVLVWCAWLRDEQVLQSETVTLRIHPSTDPDTQAYSGDGSTKAFTLSQIQVAQSDRRPTYVATTSAAATQSETQDDGVRFEGGDKLLLIERAPADPTSPTVIGPVTAASDYEADGAQLLTITEDISASWDDTIEWVVVFADYDDIAGTQDDRATYLSDNSAQTVDGDTPYRW